MNRFFIMLRLMTGLSTGGLVSVFVLTTSLGLTLALLVCVEVHPFWALVFLPLILYGPIFLIYAATAFISFNRWPGNLPFTVNGDLAVFERKGIGSEVWHACSIEVLGPGSVQDRTLLRNELEIFCKNANRRIYDTQWGKFTRWQLESPSSAIGQANSRIAWLIYRFLSGRLTTLVKRGLTVKSVQIKVSAEGVHIGAESETMSQ